MKHSRRGGRSRWADRDPLRLGGKAIENKTFNYILQVRSFNHSAVDVTKTRIPQTQLFTVAFRYIFSLSLRRLGWNQRDQCGAITGDCPGTQSVTPRRFALASKSPLRQEHSAGCVNYSATTIKKCRRPLPQSSKCRTRLGPSTASVGSVPLLAK